jgi:hypothetical protein
MHIAVAYCRLQQIRTEYEKMALHYVIDPHPPPPLHPQSSSQFAIDRIWLFDIVSSTHSTRSTKKVSIVIGFSVSFSLAQWG